MKASTYIFIGGLLLLIIVALSGGGSYKFEDYTETCYKYNLTAKNITYTTTINKNGFYCNNYTGSTVCTTAKAPPGINYKNYSVSTTNRVYECIAYTLVRYI